jgi:hypothetical protein
LYQFIGTTDDLIPRLIDGYRYRSSQPRKAEVRRQIKRMSAEEGTERSAPIPKKKPKKLPHVYLVNKAKFHSVVSDEDLQLEISANSLDDKAHQILQHKIRLDGQMFLPGIFVYVRYSSSPDIAISCYQTKKLLCHYVFKYF